MLGEPNPRLEVDADRQHHEDRQRQGLRRQRPRATRTTRSPTRTPRASSTGTHRSPSTTSSTTTAPGRASSPTTSTSASAARPATSGAAADVFEFQQTWDYVKLLNASNLNMVTNIIDVVNTDNPPLIDIRVDTSRAGTGSQHRRPRRERARRRPFDFDITTRSRRRLVQIHNTCAFTCPCARPVHPARRLHREPDRRRPRSTTPAATSSPGPAQRDHPHQRPRPRRAARQHRLPEPDAPDPRHRAQPDRGRAGQVHPPRPGVLQRRSHRACTTSS